MNSIAVYCGAKTGNNDIYTRTAQEVGTTLAQQNIKIIYGAGNVGLMGVVADSAIAHKGQIVGVIPHFLQDLEVAHTQLTELILCDSMHERKVIMTDLSQGAIILPGGFGTLDELFEILTLTQLAQVNQSIGILNINGFYDALLQHFHHMHKEGFVKDIHLNMVCVADNVEELLSLMQQQQNKLSIEENL